MKRLVLLLLLASVMASVSPAQVLTGTIAGTVTDQTGAVVPADTIAAVNTDTGQSLKVTADQAGNYTITNLTDGNYRVQETEAPCCVRSRTQHGVYFWPILLFDFHLEHGAILARTEVADH